MLDHALVMWLPPVQGWQGSVLWSVAGVHCDGVLRAKSKTAWISSVPDKLLDPARPDDVALFLHTSGTTSKPKVRSLQQLKLPR